MDWVSPSQVRRIKLILKSNVKTPPDFKSQTRVRKSYRQIDIHLSLWQRVCKVSQSLFHPSGHNLPRSEFYEFHFHFILNKIKLECLSRCCGCRSDKSKNWRATRKPDTYVETSAKFNLHPIHLMFFEIFYLNFYGYFI